MSARRRHQPHATVARWQARWHRKQMPARFASNAPGAGSRLQAANRPWAAGANRPEVAEAWGWQAEVVAFTRVHQDLVVRAKAASLVG